MLQGVEVGEECRVEGEQVTDTSGPEGQGERRVKFKDDSGLISEFEDSNLWAHGESL